MSVENIESVDQIERPVRERTYTEKGLTYQIEQRLYSIKRLISEWRSDAEKINIALSDSTDPNAITSLRDQLIKVMNELRQEYSILKSLLGTENQEAAIHTKYDDIEQEHHRLMSSVSEVLREIKGDSLSVFSKARSKISRHSSRKSPSSHPSDKQELTAKAEALEIQLKYLDIESRAKLEYERIKTLKNLDITKATLEGLKTSEDELNTGINLPTERKEDMVKKYVSTCLPDYQNRPVTIATTRSIVNPTTTAYDIKLPHVSTAAPLSQVNTEINLGKGVASNTNVKVTQSESKHSMLNPLAGPFTPNTCVGNAHGDATITSDHKVEHSFTELARTLVDQVSLGRLPPPEPTVFSGDPLLYSGWKAAFNTLVEQRKIPKNEQIHYLKRYLSGAAKESVENYFLLSSDSSYDEAKQLLDERFGDPFVIGNAFRDKLERWPKIAARESKALLKFADFLKQCHAAMVSIGTLQILDDDRENRKLISKLPDWIVTRWSRIVYQWKEDQKRFPPFKCFVDFICKEAKIASDPVTSLQSLKLEDSKTVRPTNNKLGRNFEGRSFAIETAEPQKPSLKCTLCMKAHDLDSCRTFLNKSISDRKEFARSKNLCFACLRSGHISRNCLRRKKCKKCFKLHPTSLHGDTGWQTKSSENGKDTSVKQSDTKVEPLASHTSVSHLSNGRALNKNSMVVPVYLSHCDNPEHEKLVYAMLDTQSDTTFILDDTCKSLGLSGSAVTLILSTMLAENKTVDSTKLKGLMVRGHDSTVKIALPDTFSRNLIPANRNHIPTPDIARSWPHLYTIADKLMPLASCEIGLLIGYNCSRALMPREVIPPDGDGPYGQRTDLGWGIVGIVDTYSSVNEEDAIGVSHRTLVREVPKELIPSCDRIGVDNVAFAFKTNVKVGNPSDILKMLELDFIENTVNKDMMSQEDKRFMKLISEGVKFDKGHYSMPLPFKSDPPLLPNNKFVALRRLTNQVKRFKSDEKYYKCYKEFIENLLKHGHAEKVEESDMSREGIEWYIPHHGVFHPRKPEKLRVVFDCSAIFKEQSLNSHLLQGPDLTNTLVGVLCRFRQGKIAFTCDIEQMFHQFFVHKEHRDYLRFLWWKDEEMTEPIVYRMCVHLFGATSSPGCANFGLKQIATDNENDVGKDVADFLRKDFYVDDGLKSVSSVNEAVDMIKGSQMMCMHGGLRLHKFSSNSKEVLSTISPEDRANGLKDIDIFNDKLPIELTLGVQWNIESDIFQFRIVLNDKPLTRRGILSTVSSVYDPLGFISPVILVGKQILQQTCGENIGWDDEIPDKLHMRWEQWRVNLKELADVQIRRCIISDNFNEVKIYEFHHFSDASSTGYGQCSYLRTVDVDERVHCSLLMGKARVAPRKAITIPRLELTAAVVSVKIHALLKEEFEFSSAIHYFWTDSSVVLGYIMNDARRFHVFVGNRVQQIRDHTRPSQWQYVSSKENPADIASRGATAPELINSNWFSGPQFLWQRDLPPANDYSNIASIDYLKDDPEVKKVQVFSTSVISYQPLLDILDRFSDWNKAKRVIAYCLRFKQLLLKSHDRTSEATEEVIGNVFHSVEDLQRAEVAILRIVQESHFKKDIDKLKQNVPISKDSSLYRLDPVLDDNGIIRAGGRMLQSLDVYEVKHPVILPRKCHITNLLIRHFHERVQHQGRGITTNELRSNGYWIIGCSAAVSSTIYHCVQCRKLRGRTQDQKMADLPFDRVDPAPPFSYCGVDYFGPFYIKEGRKELKRYGVIFTCFTSRAVHLEIANTLSTDSFINALRRFLCIRGPIRQLRSDRGTNFIGAENELQRSISEMDDAQIAEFLKKEGCDYFQFKTNVPHASHMGGVWERQIRTVRSVLATLLCTLGKQLDDETLRTFICEVTAIVNSRPLSVENLNDPLSSVLTPNHLLTMKSKIILPPPGKFIQPDLYVRKRWRRIQYLANEFWSRWRREYLATLQSREKWVKKKRNLKVGDVVIIKDENVSRNMWRLGRINKAHEDDNGLVRKVRLTVGSSDLDCHGVRKSKLIELDRPVHKLILLQETGEVPTEEPL